MDQPRQAAIPGDDADVAVAHHHPRAPAAPAGPGEPEEPALPDDDVPPGEHKREPIDDPDPADTKLQLQAFSRPG